TRADARLAVGPGRRRTHALRVVLRHHRTRRPGRGLVSRVRQRGVLPDVRGRQPGIVRRLDGRAIASESERTQWHRAIERHSIPIRRDTPIRLDSRTDSATVNFWFLTR